MEGWYGLIYLLIDMYAGWVLSINLYLERDEREKEGSETPMSFIAYV